MTDTESVCPACEGDSNEHDCGWMNELCPDSCATEHAVPIGIDFTCPETDTDYIWCQGCECHVYDRWCNAVVIDGQTYCDPCDHNLSRCEECGRWCSNDDLIYSDRMDAHYCDSCYEEVGHGRAAEPLTPCHVCRGTNVHLDLISEDFLCEHRALDRAQRGIPIEWATTPAIATTIVATLLVAA